MRYNKYIFSILICFFALSSFSQSPITLGEETKRKGPFKLTVQVLDAENKEALIGANLIVVETQSGEITDVDGSATLKLDKGNHTLRCSYIGYEAQDIRIKLVGNAKFKISLLLN